MSGIYIHIPFCYKKCHYCDFYSVIDFKNKITFIKAILEEIEIQKDYLGNELIKTIYFGGGTPSILTISELDQILNQIKKYHKLIENVEITIEANPDDLSNQYLKDARSISINRLSIGVQSFFNHHLQFMNRRHNAKQAKDSIELALSNGFKNISIDLIYGLPGMTQDEWQQNLKLAVNYYIPHISAYHLSIEPNTIFKELIVKGEIKEVDEEDSWKQFNLLIDEMKKADLEQYEISNYAKNKLYSRHNSAYWQQQKYLGLGPSAHSYNVNSRQWNTSNIDDYIKTINNEKLPVKKEILSRKDQFNDYVITGLRTKWGINLDKIEKSFGKEFRDHCINTIKKFIKNGVLNVKSNKINLTRKGYFLSDSIISDFLIE